MLVRIGIAALILGVSTKTLRRWDALNQLNATYRTKGKHRRYETSELYQLRQDRDNLHQSDELPVSREAVVGYVRVSSAKQKADLQRQREQVENYCQEHDLELQAIYQDIASGLNDRRRGLQRLLAHCQTGQVTQVIITYDDRLARFGTSLIEWWLTWWNMELIRIGSVKVTQTLEQRLLEDLLALMTSFTGRFHRLRRGKTKVSS